MTEPSLFDPAPEPRYVDAKSLGDVRDVFVNESYAVLIFEHGSMQISTAAFFSLSRTLSRKAVS